MGETTDSNGFFRIEQAVAGDYRLRAKKNGYATAELPLTVTAGIPREGLERLAPTRGLTLRVSIITGPTESTNLLGLDTSIMEKLRCHS